MHQSNIIFWIVPHFLNTIWALSLFTLSRGKRRKMERMRGGMGREGEKLDEEF